MDHHVQADPEILAKISEWDGTPMAGLPLDYQQYLKTFCPRFMVCASGPIPIGQTERVHIHIENLIVETAEIAESCMWEYIHYMSDQWAGYEFDQDDWDINDVWLVGGN